MSADDGGQAYPSFAIAKELKDETWTLTSPGMSFRDLAALAAMQVLLKNAAEYGFGSKDTARQAYDQADAMIARKRETEKADG